jgi:hypothetical protein
MLLSYSDEVSIIKLEVMKPVGNYVVNWGMLRIISSESALAGNNCSFKNN